MVAELEDADLLRRIGLNARDIRKTAVEIVSTAGGEWTLILERARWIEIQAARLRTLAAEAEKRGLQT